MRLLDGLLLLRLHRDLTLRQSVELLLLRLHCGRLG